MSHENQKCYVRDGTDGTDRTDVRTDSGDTICPPIENGGSIKTEWHIIAQDKSGYPHFIFLISPLYICYGFSLEAPWRGTSNEYPPGLEKMPVLQSETVFWRAGPIFTPEGH